MKHVYATLIFCSLFAGNIFGQCTGPSGIATFQSDGRGNYTFDTMFIPSHDVVGSFYLTYDPAVNTDTLMVDSNTFHTSYSFDTNGIYHMCLYTRDTVTNCSWNNCRIIVVEDADYQPMLKEVNRWRLNYGYCPVKPNNPIDPATRSVCQDLYNADEIIANRDTIVSGIPYKIVEISFGEFSIPCDWGLVREDTIERKVYCRDFSSAPEVLLYDFSLKSQDTIRLLFQDPQWYYKTGRFRVKEIEWVNLYPEKRRVYHLEAQEDIYQRDVYWVAGVGFLGHPLYPFATNYDGGCKVGECQYEPYKTIVPNGFVSQVSCFYHNEIAFYDSCTYNDVLRNPYHCYGTRDSCSYFWICGAVHEISSLKSLNISPNPTDGKITLQFDVAESSEFEVLLYSLDGRKMIGDSSLGRLTAGLQSRSMNLENLPSGFYLLECRNKEGSMFKKVVIER